MWLQLKPIDTPADTILASRIFFVIHLRTITTAHGHFYISTLLSPELRDQIWHNTLPDIRRPALYFYKKGYWRTRPLLPSEEGYDHEHNDWNLNLDFRHDLLDDFQFELPLLFVNPEARHIGVAWIFRHGIEIRTREDRPSPIFVSPFDLIQDVLYIG